MAPDFELQVGIGERQVIFDVRRALLVSTSAVFAGMFKFGENQSADVNGETAEVWYGNICYRRVWRL
jgi:hypothetical protein